MYKKHVTVYSIAHSSIRTCGLGQSSLYKYVESLRVVDHSAPWL